MIKFTLPTDDLVQELADNMRQEEVDEVWASGKHTPYEAVKYSLEHAHEAYAAVLDGKLICIVGVSPLSLLSDMASPWLLNTNESKNKPRHLVKWTKTFIDEWKTQWPILFNYVDARYEASLRWAKWAGFKVYDPQPYGPFGMPFHKIEIRRE